jgi:hypothetical protein
MTPGLGSYGSLLISTYRGGPGQPRFLAAPPLVVLAAPPLVVLAAPPLVVLAAPPSRPLPLGRRGVVSRQPHEAGVDRVRVNSGEVSQEQLPLATVQGLDARLDGRFCACPT